MLNTVVLMGRLTADPVVRNVGESALKCTFSIAVDRSFKKNGEKVTDFINSICWNGRAIFIKDWFKKGDMIAVRGSLYIDKVDDKIYPYVNVEEVSFCGGRPRVESDLSDAVSL